MASEVFCMDCMEAMREMPDNAFDLAVVDPPYGIGIGKHHQRGGGGGNTFIVSPGYRPFGGKAGNSHRAVPKSGGKSNPYHAFDDSSPPDAEYFRELRRVSRNQIIWGGNFFLDSLGRASCIIVWDKKRRELDQADCEIAWTSLKGQSRIFEFRWNGMLQGDMKHKEARIHPTQKPIALYSWIFRRYAKPGDRILDTHMGSQSSRIAAYDAGLDFTGYEIDPVYFEMGNKRFADHAAQISLFVGGDENVPALEN